MKKFLVVFSFACILLLLVACGDGQDNTQSTNLSTEVTDMINSKYVLNGTVAEINENSIEITIENTNTASGTYVVNISESTTIYDKFGNKISLNEIKLDNKVEVSYNGQVTKSIPPQVSAIEIQVK